MPEEIIEFGGEIVFKGANEFARDMGKSRREVKKTDDAFDKMGRRVRKTTKAFAQVGRGVMRASKAVLGVAKVAGMATLAIGGLAATAIKKFGDFEMQMARIGTLLPSATSGMNAFGKSVRTASVRFGQDLGQTSNAFFQAISAGVGADKAENFFDTVGKAATGSFAQMDTVVDGLTNSINGFGLSMSDAETVSDKFFVANKRGKTTFGELSASIGLVGPMAASMNVSLDETLATVVSLTLAGNSTSQAMTGLRQIIASVSKPTAEAKKEAKRLGVEFGAAALKSKGFMGFMTDLKAAVTGPDGAADSLQQLFGSVEAQTAAARLLSTDGIGSMTNALNEMSNAAGATEDAFKRVQKTVGFKLKQMKAGFESVVVRAGEGLVRGFGLANLADIPSAMEDAGSSMLSAGELFARGFKKAFNPVNVAASQDWKGLAATLGDAAGTITTAFIDVGVAFTEMLPTIKRFIGGMVDALKAAGAVLRFLYGGAGTAAKKTKVDIAGKSGRTVRPIGDASLLDHIPVETSASVGIWLQKGKLDKAKESWNAASGTMSPWMRKQGLRMINAGVVPAGTKEQAAQASKAIGKVGGFGSVSSKFTGSIQDSSRARIEGSFARLVPSSGTHKTGGKGFTSPVFDGGGTDKSFGVGVIPPTTAMHQPAWQVNIGIANEVGLQDGKKPPKRGGGGAGRRASFRGRGNATIKSTSEQLYVIFGDELVPISDENSFEHLVGAGEAGP
jgi:TP901 family phage tail tape measure protein